VQFDRRLPVVPERFDISVLITQPKPIAGKGLSHFCAFVYRAVTIVGSDKAGSGTGFTATGLTKGFD
jgi:hypothetical protein